MANVRKTITASLGSLNDSDLFEFLDQMDEKGITVSKLVKDALRYYRDNCVYQKTQVDSSIDYKRIESIVENSVKKLFEEVALTKDSTAVRDCEAMDFSEAENALSTEVEQTGEAKAHEDEQGGERSHSKGEKDEEANDWAIKDEETPEGSLEVKGEEKELVETESVEEVESKEKIEARETATTQKTPKIPVEEKKETVDNSDLEALVNSMIKIR